MSGVKAERLSDWNEVTSVRDREVALHVAHHGLAGLERAGVPPLDHLGAEVARDDDADAGGAGATGPAELDRPAGDRAREDAERQQGEEDEPLLHEADTFTGKAGTRPGLVAMSDRVAAPAGTVTVATPSAPVVAVALPSLTVAPGTTCPLPLSS